MFRQIAHTAYRVQDMEAALDFYCGKLGFRRAFDLHHPETGNPWIIYIQVASEQFIELFYPDAELRAGNRYMHLCLETADLAAAVAELRRRGVPIWREIRQGVDRNLQAWIKDPDGNEIELMQIDPGSPQAHAFRTWADEPSP
jgi:lactoylglutathione lyase